MYFNILLLTMYGPKALFTFNIARISFTSVSMIIMFFNTEWLVTDVCHQPILEKIATASRLSLAKTRTFCW